MIDHLRLRFRRWRYASARCESCGAVADAVLRDRSMWCSSCHGSAITLGYDLEFGKAIR